MYFVVVIRIFTLERNRIMKSIDIMLRLNSAIWVVFAVIDKARISFVGSERLSGS